MPDMISQIDKELRDHGTASDRARLEAARKALDFLHARFELWNVRPPEYGPYTNRFKRLSLLMKRAIDTLSADLYRKGPARRLPDHPAADKWLSDLYAKLGVDGLLQQADRLSLAADVCAIEATPGDSTDVPVKLRLWDAASFLVWTSDSDPLQVIAVATIDRVDETRRLTLWSDGEIRRYSTDKLGVGQTSGGTAYRLQSVETNPYGFIPFAFVWGEQPSCDFWTPSVGGPLAEVNDYVNQALTDLGDSIRFNLKPVIVAKGVPAGWRPPSIVPGAVWDLPSTPNAAGVGMSPDVSYLQSDTSFVESAWNDINNYIDHTLEAAGIPPAAYRLSQSAVKSGTALVAEQIPLARWAESRTRPFSLYEQKLATLVLKMGAFVLAYNDHPSAALEAAAADPGLVVHFPQMLPGLVGKDAVDQAAADRAALDLGITSRVRIVMERNKLTREEALAYLESVAEDEAAVNSIVQVKEPAETTKEVADAESIEDAPGEEDANEQEQD